MTQTIPAIAVLGPGKTGLAIGYRVLNLDTTTYSAFTTTGVAETAVLGTYHAASGITVPDAGAYVIFGTAATDYAETTVDSAVWSAAIRTLTSTAEDTTAAVTGSALSLSIGASYSKTISSLTIPATWAKAWFTVKNALAPNDTKAIIQIMVSNPASALTDGLLTINGTSTALANGSLALDTGAGTATIDIIDTSGIPASGSNVNWYYDIKVKLSTGRFQQLTASTITTAYIPTQAVA